MSQIYLNPLGSGGGFVASITGTAPIEANGESGVAQTGPVTISITDATAGTNVTAALGAASFNEDDFTVVDGFVSSSGSTANSYNVDVVDSTTPAISPGAGTVIPVSNVLQITGQNGIITSELENTPGAYAVRFDYDHTSTVGATTHTLLPLTTATNSCAEVNILVAAFDITNGLGAGGRVRATVKNVAGTASIVGTPDILLEWDSGLAGISMTATLTGDIISLSVTGIAGHTIAWDAILQGTVDTSGIP